MIKALVIGGALADIRLVGFATTGEVDLRKEFSGETELLAKAAEESDGKTIMRGVKFRFDGMTRFSVLTFKNGLLADVADCNLHEGAGESGLKVFCLNGVNLGLIVDDDIDSEMIWRRLAEKSDGIVCIVRTFDSEREKRVKRLQEYFGIGVAVCHDGGLAAYGCDPVELQQRD